MNFFLRIGLIGALACVFGCNRSPDTTTDQVAPPAETSEAGADTNAAPAGKETPVRTRTTLTSAEGDQGASDADLEISRRIRGALMASGPLSNAAAKIKIITEDGNVTLRGQVETEQERINVAAIVKQLRVGSVTNRLEVRRNR